LSDIRDVAPVELVEVDDDQADEPIDCDAYEEQEPEGEDA
jgi:hypothetical protein